MASYPGSTLISIVRSHDTLSQNVEVGLMGRKSQHDQIGICSINTVSCIGFVIRRCSLTPDEIKNFMFTFSWYKSIRKHYDQIFPMWIVILSLENITSQSFGQIMHKVSSGSDSIFVKRPSLISNSDTINSCAHSSSLFAFPLSSKLIFSGCAFFFFQSRSESSGSLLVQLCPWSNSIDGQI
jgi:hypothetical protein